MFYLLLFSSSTDYGILSLALIIMFSHGLVNRKSGTNSYDVDLDDAALIGGGFGYPLELGSKFVLELL